MVTLTFPSLLLCSLTDPNIVYQQMKHSMEQQHFHEKQGNCCFFKYAHSFWLYIYSFKGLL